MGSFSLWHWLVVGIVILLLFGRGRFSEMMGDVAKGLKSFKKGMSEDDEPMKPAARLDTPPPPPVVDRAPDPTMTPLGEDRRP